MQRKIKSLRRFYPLLPALFFVVVYLLPLGFRTMIRPDEFRYAEIPREMLESGAWMRPRLDGVKYFEKPTLGYQLIALSMKVFGKNRFAVRLPSALGTLIAAAMIWLILRRESRERFWPGAAAGMYLASALVLGTGTFAVLDAPFAGAVTVSIGAVYLACRSPRRAECALYLAAAGAAAAVAFMLNGFLAFILPGMVAAAFLIWSREWKKLFVFPWLPLAIVLLIAIPWALAQHRADPDFWRYFFVEEHWKRFTSGTYDRKAQPFWYFFPVLLGGVMPAGLLWFAGAVGCTKEWFKRPFVRFMICWFALPFLLFSASKCKLGTYILPCFPPLALLLASAFRNARRCGREKFRARCKLLYTILGVALAAAAIVGAAALAALPFLPKKLAAKAPGPLTDWINAWSILAVVALLAFGMILYRLRRNANAAALWAFLTGLAPAICFG
ncbi:MAG: phospholipid carrier-dependent glycosyltransferase, partial [Lentisphaeria bacterium]|nr:phospholipid carrier-dependent glycosyltransferase [Lentisphaeria bacterium]